MKRFIGILVFDGKVRRLTFEAVDEAEAKLIALKMGVGFDGETTADEEKPQREAYDEATARHILGDISSSTLYRWIAIGKLKRVPGTGKILVTRQSIEQAVAGR